jgi:hypothetical protein
MCLHTRDPWRQPTLIVTLTTTVGRCLALRALLLPQVDCSSIPNSVPVAGVCRCAAAGFNITALSNSTLLACLPSSSPACPPAYPLPTRQGATGGGIQSCSTANSVCPSGSVTMVDAAYNSAECRVGVVSCQRTAYFVSWYEVENGGGPPLACAPAKSTCPPRSYPTLGGPLALPLYVPPFTLAICYLKDTRCGSIYTILARNFTNGTADVVDGCFLGPTCPSEYPISVGNTCYKQQVP